jgi:hypothetical protein
MLGLNSMSKDAQRRPYFDGEGLHLKKKNPYEEERLC